MDKNLPRWIFQSVAEHFRTVAEDISLPYFVEGIDERSEETMEENHVELRVTGPSMKEVSNGYYNVDVVINFMFTKAMDPVDSNAYDLIQWTGVFADIMLLPIPIYMKGSGVDDTGDFVGCLQIGKGRHEAARIYHFGQLDKDTAVRQSEVDAVFHMDYVVYVFDFPATHIEGTFSTIVMDSTVDSEGEWARLGASDISFVSSASQIIARDFVSTWNTSNVSSGSSNNVQVALPLTSNGSYDFTVFWGDSNQDDITAYDDPAVTHTYSSGGEYEIRISGDIEGWRFNNTNDKLKIANVISWGPLVPSNDGFQFRGCTNLTSNATDALLLGTLTSLEAMFYDCVAFEPVGIDNWDVSNITTLKWAFFNCEAFNQDIGSWNTANVTNMTATLQGCDVFNQDISSWNTANVTIMVSTFKSCTTFNQDIGSWNTANVTNMTGMLQNCTAFNQNIGSWNTANVMDMSTMLQSCSNFNQNIGSWNTVKVTNMSNMLATCPTFNQDIGSWNTANVTGMTGMLNGCSDFDQDIGSWNTVNVTNMTVMFFNCLAFDQDLGSWNIEKVTTMANMFLNATLSTANYDSTLIGWAAQTVKTGVNFHGGNSTYSEGTANAARETLLTSNWVITDGGLA